MIVMKGFGGGGGGSSCPHLQVTLYSIPYIFPRSTYNTCHPLFLTKHSLMPPLIWCLIGLVNLSGSVAEANDTGVVYLGYVDVFLRPV